MTLQFGIWVQGRRIVFAGDTKMRSADNGFDSIVQNYVEQRAVDLQPAF
jgi:hypothetical protein